MIKKKDLSKEDINTWKTYIKNPSDIYDKDKNSLQNQERKDRFKFDLHGYTLDEANLKVRELIIKCVKNKYKEILLITGKGLHSNSDGDAYVSKNLSKLKYSVPEFIKSNEELSKLIISLSEADLKDGGEGAILIKLKNL
ncbi:Smr/MutS family protein [Candidatus Pelagibacter bacterium]|nr:Smr/MutS family protein [Candidatus Pelagibacter bacterium]